MTSNGPWRDTGRRQQSTPYVEAGTNPTWIGNVSPVDYRPAPGHEGGPVRPIFPGPPPLPRRGARGTLLPLLLSGAGIALLSLVVVVPFLLSNTGVAGFTVGFVASLVPLSAVLFTVYFIDRWEPEPKGLLLFAFTWGAAVSIAGTLLIQPLFAVVAPRSSEEEYLFFMATVQAPVAEEFAKALGLLLLLLGARKYFDGPVDGVVFAFTIAGGFAFTENILYFGSEIATSSDPGEDFVRVFILRGIMSPFAHAIFTGTTGLIMGFAARRWHSGQSVLAFFVGLVPAMILHNRWNSMGQDFLAQYLGVQVPIFIIAIVAIALLRVAERKLTRQRLMEYAHAGWFTPLEVEMLATPRGRRSAVQWARRRGRERQMKAFVQAATDLALTRQRILSGRDVVRHQDDEMRQLAHILPLRNAVAA